MTSLQGYITPSHILYVDDIFVFVGQIISLLEIWLSFLKHMVIFLVNMLIILKVAFFSMDTSARFVTKIQFLLSYSHGYLPFNYLGVSIYVGAPKY